MECGEHWAATLCALPPSDHSSSVRRVYPLLLYRWQPMIVNMRETGQTRRIWLTLKAGHENHQVQFYPIAYGDVTKFR